MSDRRVSAHIHFEFVGEVAPLVVAIFGGAGRLDESLKNRVVARPGFGVAARPVRGPSGSQRCSACSVGTGCGGSCRFGRCCGGDIVVPGIGAGQVARFGSCGDTEVFVPGFKIFADASRNVPEIGDIKGNLAGELPEQVLSVDTPQHSAGRADQLVVLARREIFTFDPADCVAGGVLQGIKDTLRGVQAGDAKRRRRTVRKFLAVRRHGATVAQRVVDEVPGQQFSGTVLGSALGYVLFRHVMSIAMRVMVRPHRPIAFGRGQALDGALLSTNPKCLHILGDKGMERRCRRGISGRRGMQNIHPRRWFSGKLPVGKAKPIWNHEPLDSKIVSTPGKWFPHA